MLNNFKIIAMEKDETDLDIVDVLNAVISGEKHLPGMQYCGPGTNLIKKLNPDGTPKPQYLPVDRVDEIAVRHDIAYQNNSELRSRNKADTSSVCLRRRKW